jgi:hypothetical protein
MKGISQAGAVSIGRKTSLHAGLQRVQEGRIELEDDAAERRPWPEPERDAAGQSQQHHG